MNEPKEFKLDPENELHQLVISNFEKCDAFAVVIEELSVRIKRNRKEAWELLHKIFNLDKNEEWRYNTNENKVVNLEHLIKQGLNIGEEE